MAAKKNTKHRRKRPQRPILKSRAGSEMIVVTIPLATRAKALAKGLTLVKRRNLQEPIRCAMLDCHGDQVGSLIEQVDLQKCIRELTESIETGRYPRRLWLFF
jgi:hypothetical protein